MDKTTMKNLKNYRNKELRYYLIANIVVLLLLLDFFNPNKFGSNEQVTELISTFLNRLVRQRENMI